MRRAALQEPLTDAEMQDCTDIVGKYNLYTILNAAFAKADHEGLTVSLDLRTRAAKRRKRSPSPGGGTGGGNG